MRCICLCCSTAGSHFEILSVPVLALRSAQANDTSRVSLQHLNHESFFKTSAGSLGFFQSEIFCNLIFFWPSFTVRSPVMDLLTLAGLFQLRCAGFVLIILTMEGSGSVDGGGGFLEQPQRLLDFSFNPAKHLFSIISTVMVTSMGVH